MDESDKLVEIASDSWIALRNLFLRDWPKHEFAYHLLGNYAKWKERHPNLDVHLFSLNGNWRSDETFVLKDGFEIYFYSSDEDDGSTLLLRLLGLIPWDSYSEISMDYLDKHHSDVEKIISEKRLTVASSNLANYYFLPKEQALELSSPPPAQGFRFDRIQLKDLDFIYNQWPLRSHISYDAGLGLLSQLISLNESVGLFNEKGELISWCLSDQTGAHSDLQTVHAHHRKGYGRMVVIELAKRLARTGADSKAYVLQENEKSIRLFEAVGFRRFRNLHWVVLRRRQ